MRSLLKKARIIVLFIVGTVISACSLSTPAPFFVEPAVPIIGAPVDIEKKAIQLTEVVVTPILESQITRHPGTPAPGDPSEQKPTEALLPPGVEPEAVGVFLMSAEYSSEKTIIRLRVIPPQNLFHPLASTFLPQAELVDEQGQKYLPILTNNLTLDMVEIEFPPLPEEARSFELRVIPEINHVPSAQPLMVDVHEESVDSAWEVDQQLVFGGVPVQVTKIRLASAESDNSQEILRVEIEAENTRQGNLQVSCLELELPNSLFQGTGSCGFGTGGLESSIDLILSSENKDKVLSSPLEINVYASFLQEQETVISIQR